jgi:integrase/recombinase XerD
MMAKTKPCWAKVTGPLAEYADGFRAELFRLGYTPLTAACQIRLTAHLSRWLTAECLAAQDLDMPTAERYFAGRRLAGYANERTTEALGPLLGYLRGLRAAPPPPAEPATETSLLLDRFVAYLASERGLAPATVTLNVRLVRPFLQQRAPGHDGHLDLEQLTAGEVRAFVLAQARTQPRSAKRIVTALRSLLRFLHVDGVLAVPLAGAVPSPAGHALAGLPRALEPGQIQAMLDSCDLATATGRRDRAVLLMLSRMGLRAGEAAGLGLDDIDWRRGEITVLGKGSRRDRLPLRRGDRRLPARRPPGRRAGPHGVHRRPGTPGSAVLYRDHHDRRRCRRPGRDPRAGPRPPPAPLGRDRDAARRRVADRDRAGSPPCPAGHDCHLREGRHRRAAPAGPPLARTGGNRMTADGRPLRDSLEDYLALRRALGFRLATAGRLLDQFVSWLDDRGSDTITTEDALAWAVLPPGASQAWQSIRLSMVRGFAAYLHGTDPSVQVPPPGLIRRGNDRATPYIYSDAEISAIISAAGTLRPRFRAATYQALISLLAASGVRIGEALSFDRSDLDTDDGVLTVRDSKFGKTRLVPLHPTAAAALARYSALRDEHHPRPGDPALFLSTAGTRLRHSNVSLTFSKLTAKAGLTRRSASCRPRIHDVRHSYAVATVLGWYRDGADVAAMMPRLSTYLGHTDPKHTYWYLSAAPELMALAGDRLHAHLNGES